MTLKVYQIGLGSFGRYGFEKLVEMTEHFQKVDVELAGICDEDHEKLEKARIFAEANEVDLETFTDIEAMYEAASAEDENVMVYDVGPSELHAENIEKSLKNNFFHLGEKPPSFRRKEHIRQKELAERNDAMWKVDFIERENPVVKKAEELVEEKMIDRIEVFRENSLGVEKVIQNTERQGVNGGDILDKMVHEIYVLDLLESSGKLLEPDLKDVQVEYFLPMKENSERMMSIDGGYTSEISYNTSTAQTTAKFDVEGTEVILHSGWLGLSEESRLAAKKIGEKIDASLLKQDYSQLNGKLIPDEEARFFIIQGQVNLVGDMLHQKLYDLDLGEQVELDYMIHDQLYRVLERAVMKATGKDVQTISDKEIDTFMNMVFDVKEEAVTGDFLEELEKANSKINKMVVDEGKVIEARDSETVAG